MQGSGSARVHRPRARWRCKQAHPPITRAAPRHLMDALGPRRLDSRFLHSAEDGSYKSIAAVSIPEVMPSVVATLGLDSRGSPAIVLATGGEVGATRANPSSRAFLEFPNARARVDH